MPVIHERAQPGEYRDAHFNLESMNKQWGFHVLEKFPLTAFTHTLDGGCTCKHVELTLARWDPHRLSATNMIQIFGPTKTDVLPDICAHTICGIPNFPRRDTETCMGDKKMWAGFHTHSVSHTLCKRKVLLVLKGSTKLLAHSRVKCHSENCCEHKFGLCSYTQIPTHTHTHTFSMLHKQPASTHCINLCFSRGEADFSCGQ